MDGMLLRMVPIKTIIIAMATKDVCCPAVQVQELQGSEKGQDQQKRIQPKRYTWQVRVVCSEPFRACTQTTVLLCREHT